MPRRAPRSRHRSAKLSARRLLTPQWRAWSIRPLQHPVRLLLLMDLASPLRVPRERGLRLSHPRRLRCRRSMPRLLPDDAPPERLGGLLGGRRTGEVGRPVHSRRSTPAPTSRRVESRSQRTVTLGSRRTVGVSSLIQSRGLSPIVA